jgi:hypothetical protein
MQPSEALAGANNKSEVFPSEQSAEEIGKNPMHSRRELARSGSSGVSLEYRRHSLSITDSDRVEVKKMMVILSSQKQFACAILITCCQSFLAIMCGTNIHVEVSTAEADEFRSNDDYSDYDAYMLHYTSMGIFTIWLTVKLVLCLLFTMPAPARNTRWSRCTRRIGFLSGLILILLPTLRITGSSATAMDKVRRSSIIALGGLAAFRQKSQMQKILSTHNKVMVIKPDKKCQIRLAKWQEYVMRNLILIITVDSMTFPLLASSVFQALQNVLCLELILSVDDWILGLDDYEVGVLA